jgi:hypothetical protein
MKNLYPLAAMLFFIASCQSNSSSLLVGKWSATALKNPAMDREIAKAIEDIDTFGNTDLEIRNVINIDSFKQLRKQMMNDDIAEQKKALQEISYTFSEKGIAYISDGLATDSALWTIEDKNILKIDAPALTGLGDLQLFTIASISENNLVLQMAVGTDTSQMTLQKIK